VPGAPKALKTRRLSVLPGAMVTGGIQKGKKGAGRGEAPEASGRPIFLALIRGATWTQPDREPACPTNRRTQGDTASINRVDPGFRSGGRGPNTSIDFVYESTMQYPRTPGEISSRHLTGVPWPTIIRWEALLFPAAEPHSGPIVFGGNDGGLYKSKR